MDRLISLSDTNQQTPPVPTHDYSVSVDLIMKRLTMDLTADSLETRLSLLAHLVYAIHMTQTNKGVELEKPKAANS